jgi:hypothetical protein
MCVMWFILIIVFTGLDCSPVPIMIQSPLIHDAVHSVAAHVLRHAGRLPAPVDVRAGPYPDPESSFSEEDDKTTGHATSSVGTTGVDESSHAASSQSGEETTIYNKNIINIHNINNNNHHHHHYHHYHHYHHDNKMADAHTGRVFKNKISHSNSHIGILSLLSSMYVFVCVCLCVCVCVCVCACVVESDATTGGVLDRSWRRLDVVLNRTVLLTCLQKSQLDSTLPDLVRFILRDRTGKYEIHTDERVLFV